MMDNLYWIRGSSFSDNALAPSKTGGQSDYDPDGDPIKVTSFQYNPTFKAGTIADIKDVSGILIGTFQLNEDGSYIFNPLPNYNGQVRIITYTIADGNGGTATATIDLLVRDKNNPPVAVSDNKTILEDNPLTGNVLSNDSDIDNNTLSITSVTITGVSSPVTIGQPFVFSAGTI